MKIELVQLAGRDGDVVHNLGRTLEAIATCAADTDLLIFPETHLTGFVDASGREQQRRTRNEHRLRTPRNARYRFQ